jgi:hypothetical protein
MRPLTLLVVGAIAVLGAVAVADAIRGEPETEPAPPTTTGDSSGAVSTDVAGLHGVLYYTDESCQLRGLELPELRPAAPREAWNECEFTLSPDGRRVGSEGTAWDPRGLGFAVESEGSILAAATEGVAVSFLGSAPAFTPGGVLSFVRDGAVRGLDLLCLRRIEPAEFVDDDELARCSRELLRARDLRRAARKHPNVPDEPRFLLRVGVKEAAWLGRERLVAVLTLDIRFVGRYEALAVFEGARLLRLLPALGPRFSSLRASSRGSYFAVGTENPAGILLFDADGRPLTLPELADPHAVAWSPGETWTAVATRASVYVFRSESPEADLRRLGIRAADLAWR